LKLSKFNRGNLTGFEHYKYNKTKPKSARLFFKFYSKADIEISFGKWLNISSLLEFSTLISSITTRMRLKTGFIILIINAECYHSFIDDGAFGVS